MVRIGVQRVRGATSCNSASCSRVVMRKCVCDLARRMAVVRPTRPAPMMVILIEGFGVVVGGLGGGRVYGGIGDYISVSGGDLVG